MHMARRQNETTPFTGDAELDAFMQRFIDGQVPVRRRLNNPTKPIKRGPVEGPLPCGVAMNQGIRVKKVYG